MLEEWKQVIPGMAYLAIPYTGELGENCPMEKREQGFAIANGVAAYFMSVGEIVFSPISHSHPIHFFMGDRGHDHKFWMDYNREMTKYCNRLYVVCWGNWKASKGVMAEFSWFKQDKKPIFLVALLGGGKMGMAYAGRGNAEPAFPVSTAERKNIIDMYA